MMAQGVTRRAFCGGLAAAMFAAKASAAPIPVTRDLFFHSKERQARLFGENGPSSAVWSYTDELFPVFRVAHGDRLRVTLKNELMEHTSIHWHGVRVPNSMDGVQYVTQPPVEPGESFLYDITPPDTGTFFFHPHCNETGQVGHGLAGVLIVEGDEDQPFDDDIVLVAKDWRLNPDGLYLDFVTDKGAGTAGTFGTVRSVNGRPKHIQNVPAGADIRIRILNLDSTRIMEIGAEGGDAFIIAIDGNPVPPIRLDTWKMGSAMRLDLVLRTPMAGSSAKIIDYFSSEIFILAELVATGEVKRQSAFYPAPLKASAIPEPDLANAVGQDYVFGAASDSVQSFLNKLDPADPLYGAILDSLCTGERTFWAINKVSWPNDGHRNLPPPLARLEAGRSYRFTLQNVTPHPHPIHLHGHTFKVLSSSRRDLPVHYADTVLLMPKERIDIAFVARQGNWMFHCHILEHLETGMMGYFHIA
jgi:FtsP/CotA-like multicopper oxidase with cupredoxin domain